MTTAVGWAQPALALSEPRLQKTDGFHYLYAEVNRVHESAVGGAVGTCFGRIFPAWSHAFGKTAPAPTLAFFIDIPGDKGWYDVQMGFAVPEGTEPYGETFVRYVPPALVAGILVWGDLPSIPKSYGALMEFANKSGHARSGVWREWYLLFESDTSANNITWVQYELMETT